jgi:hypothetical protein
MTEGLNETHEIDPHTCDLDALLELYDVKLNKIIDFKFNNQFNNGYGRGADVYCKTILLKRVLEYYFESCPDDIRYIIFKTYNFMSLIKMLKVRKLAKFIKSCIASNVLLPKHLHPKFVEVIINRKLTVDELMYYLNHMDSDMHKYVSKLDESYRMDSTKFQEISPAYESLEDMLRQKVVGDKIIGWGVDLCRIFDFNFNNAIELDSSISEPYIITNELVVAVFKITPVEYETLWCRFVMELDQEELKAMLVLFTGATTIPSAIHLRIDEDMKCDLNIHVCGYSLSINKRLFESYDVLSRLKIYFVSSIDSVDDSRGNARRGHVMVSHNTSREHVRAMNIDFNIIDADVVRRLTRSDFLIDDLYDNVRPQRGGLIDPRLGSTDS